MIASAADPAGERLSKRVARLLACSRLEAEQAIAGGYVTVDGQVVELPQYRVHAETVRVDPHASLSSLAPVTLLLHKPAGEASVAGQPAQTDLFLAQQHFPADRSGIRPLKRHFQQQICLTALEAQASGLVVYSQDARIRRKLLEEGALVEHETMVEVSGPVDADRLRLLNQSPVVDGRAMAAGKVSISRQSGPITGLRFALKGSYPGRIAVMCENAGLQVVAIKRIRIGRLPVSGLPSGQWRYLLPYERF